MISITPIGFSSKQDSILLTGDKQTTLVRGSEATSLLDTNEITEGSKQIDKDYNTKILILSELLRQRGWFKQAHNLERSVFPDSVAFECGCSGKYLIVPLDSNNYKLDIKASSRRGWNLLKMWLPVLKGVHVPKYMTEKGLKLLTLSFKPYPSIEELVKVGMPDIKQAFKRFFDSDYIKERIEGGFYALEIKPTETGYYLHLHAVILSRYLDNRSHNSKTPRFFNDEGLPLSSLAYYWYRSTNKQAYVVDIRPCFGLKGGLNYVLKYCSKPYPLNNYDLVEFFIQSYRKRMLVRFGSFYDIKLFVSKCKCPDCGQPYSVVLFSSNLAHEVYSEQRALAHIGLGVKPPS